MHLKNFALLTTEENDIVLAPAYDLLCTKIAMPSDMDEMALTINAKKRKITRLDFDGLAKNLKINNKTIQNSFMKFVKKLDDANEWIDISFLPKEMKKEYKKVISENFKKLEF